MNDLKNGKEYINWNQLLMWWAGNTWSKVWGLRRLPPPQPHCRAGNDKLRPLLLLPEAAFNSSLVSLPLLLHWFNLHFWYTTACNIGSYHQKPSPTLRFSKELRTPLIIEASVLALNPLFTSLALLRKPKTNLYSHPYSEDWIDL